MLIEKAGCVTFYYATKIGDWWADIIATDPIMDCLDLDYVVGFKTYKWADEAVKAEALTLVVGPSKKEKPGYVGLYLAKEKELPEGYSEVVK
jgi:hypothetical protein